jgi:hypothetical protein
MMLGYGDISFDNQSFVVPCFSAMKRSSKNEILHKILVSEFKITQQRDPLSGVNAPLPTQIPGPIRFYILIAATATTRIGLP